MSRKTPGFEVEEPYLVSSPKKLTKHVFFFFFFSLAFWLWATKLAIQKKTFFSVRKKRNWIEVSVCISFLSAALYQVAYGPVPTRGPEVGDHWFRSRERKRQFWSCFYHYDERRKSILFCATALCGGSADVESVQESCFEAGSWISVKMTLFIKLHECSGSIQIIQEIDSLNSHFRKCCFADVLLLGFLL